MEHSRERPGVHESVVRQLDQRERVELLPEPLQRNASSPGCRRETRAHVAERRRSGNGLRQTKPGERHLIAIHGDSITTEQPRAILSLSLSEQLEVEVP